MLTGLSGENCLLRVTVPLSPPPPPLLAVRPTPTSPHPHELLHQVPRKETGSLDWQETSLHTGTSTRSQPAQQDFKPCSCPHDVSRSTSPCGFPGAPPGSLWLDPDVTPPGTGVGGTQLAGGGRRAQERTGTPKLCSSTRSKHASGSAGE